ncbi:hypothetical protein K2173_002036 [Erythroxylum novogranatense]|uniref:Myb/SANT-like DNA-binding domain-containing protein n=1 Tax=Erythroxylum novogranatense TaxID=1862640 RepID=A0AAV8SPC8_9ROSI|nr:hypothetical protein K2173_002036 [Erythroxylum novogranatense]
MERNGLPGGIFSGVGSSMLGLEVAVPHQQQQNPQNPQNQQNPHHLHHPQMVAYPHHESDLHPQQSAKHGFSYASAKPRQQSSLSDEDEPGFTGDDSTSDGKRKISPWQRMKWTDSMVRLLIMAVYYIGDEVGSEAIDPTGKKKAGGLSQKKGKWKSVSRAMMEKGFYVSPQQCEDKFNDLNKRYKRVNDILGKGTACKVVENQNLLDTMDLSPKRKDEVKKLLNSKHLFFREMCAYHNSCGHSTTGVASGNNHSPEVATDQSHAQPPQATLQQQQQQQQQQRCSHSSENAHIMTNSRAEMEARRVRDEDDEEDDDNSEGDDDVSDDDEDGYEAREGRGQNRHVSDGEDDHDEKSSHKRPRKEALLLSSLMQRLNGELTTVIQDGAKSLWEKKQYMKLKLLQLEEQQVSYQYQAIELEKQRVKWVKFSSKKEREMERAKLENERSRLENDKMVLCIRQKELELLHHHHSHQQQMSSNKRSDPSSITG